MQSENRLFDDLVKIMNGAAGTLAGMTREAEAATRARLREFIGGLDFVSRDEFEAVKAMAAAARDDAEGLRARLDKLAPVSPTPAAATAETPATGSLDTPAIPDPDVITPGH